MYREACPEGTFLDAYLQYADAVETPLAYDFWTGIWLLSCAAGRQITVRRPEAPVFLNIYAVLCADAGVTRKSSALRRAEAVYREAGLHEQRCIITGPTTPEALVRELGLRSHEGRLAHADICVSELVTFLGREQYNIAMPGLLTDLYDCPSIREGRRVSGDGAVIRDAYLTLLGASTSSWLVRAINPDVIEGGFTSRCLFIVEEKRKRLIAWPANAPGRDSSRTRASQLLHDSVLLCTKYAERGITLNDAALDRFVSWYERRTVNNTDPFTASFEAREDHHIL